MNTQVFRERLEKQLKTVDDEIIVLTSRLERAHGAERFEFSNRIEMLEHRAQYLWVLLKNTKRPPGTLGHRFAARVDQLGASFALRLDRWFLHLDEHEAARMARRKTPSLFRQSTSDRH